LFVKLPTENVLLHQLIKKQIVIVSKIDKITVTDYKSDLKVSKKLK